MLKQIFIFIVVGHRFAFSPCDLFDWHRSTFELSTKYYSFFFGRFSRQSFFQYRRYHITKMQSISEADVENNTDGMLKSLFKRGESFGVLSNKFEQFCRTKRVRHQTEKKKWNTKKRKRSQRSLYGWSPCKNE